MTVLLGSAHGITANDLARLAKGGGEPNDVFNSLDLPAEVLACLNEDYNYDVTGAPLPPPNDFWVNRPEYDYWNTDAFVAKLDPATGDVIWTTQFDMEPEGRFAGCPAGRRCA